jgi:alkanesulfonate monooxygenase SsuD/methylene tetrahydromethanopterin reductase-like flavin-dependent oxidoreductase (luciferase family)
MFFQARNPLRVAKEVSTLDAVSNGRFDLGIGMGWMPEEFEAGGPRVSTQRSPS